MGTRVMTPALALGLVVCFSLAVGRLHWRGEATIAGSDGRHLLSVVDAAQQARWDGRENKYAARGEDKYAAAGMSIREEREARLQELEALDQEMERREKRAEGGDEGTAEHFSELSHNTQLKFYGFGIGTVAAIGVLSVFLENMLHKLQHWVQGSFMLNKVVTNIIHEVTVLGMLSFALFFFAQVVPEEFEEYIALVEDLHMMLFIWMGLWIGIVCALFAHVELLFLFFAMAEKSPDGQGIKSDRISRYCCILNYLSSSGPEQFLEYRRHRALFVKNFMRSRSGFSSSGEGYHGTMGDDARGGGAGSAEAEARGVDFVEDDFDEAAQAMCEEVIRRYTTRLKSMDAPRARMRSLEGSARERRTVGSSASEESMRARHATFSAPKRASTIGPASSQSASTSTFDSLSATMSERHDLPADALLLESVASAEHNLVQEQEEEAVSGDETMPSTKSHPDSQLYSSLTSSDDSDFHFNEYLVIMSWKQLLHFLNLDWKIWVFVVTALTLLYVWAVVLQLPPQYLLLGLDLLSFVLVFMIAFVLNRYIYPKRLPDPLRLFKGSRPRRILNAVQAGELDIEEDLRNDSPLPTERTSLRKSVTLHPEPANLSIDKPRWKQKMRLLIPLPWELLLLKTAIFLQIGIAAIALVFPDLMWGQWGLSWALEIVFSVQLGFLPIATLGNATRFFPQFLLSASLRFPLKEVLQGLGYVEEDEDELQNSQFYARRRKAEKMALRAMLQYRVATRNRKQARKWIPFVVKNKKIFNIVLGILVVLLFLLTIVMGVLNITLKDDPTAWTGFFLTIFSLYFLLLLPGWQFVGPLRWFSKHAALAKIVPNGNGGVGGTSAKEAPSSHRHPAPAAPSTSLHATPGKRGVHASPSAFSVNAPEEEHAVHSLEHDDPRITSFHGVPTHVHIDGSAH
eukprot:TRINITY_DN9405_c0_g1_i1.p1 TRINITY_DN9405_c0_g1~~TRINITY_DN9405_c0_g1_i1.p1  ORF type:complete len:913 (-),score=234.07 TRINITY_DN9405_c0_g1_i1:123-2861(-)